MNLMDQIQADLIDESAGIVNSLRKARVLAHQLSSPELRDWVKSELDGYPDFDKVPSYRRLLLPVFGTFHGSFQRRMTGVPITTDGIPEEYRNIVNPYAVTEGVAALELALEPTDHEPRRKFPPVITELLREEVHMTGGMVLFEAYQIVPRYLIAGVVDSVKNKLLEFVLELEGSNVTPEAMSEGKVDPEVVRKAVNIYIYGNNNIVAGGENIHQEVKTVLEGDVESLVAHLKSHKVSEQDIDELKDAVSAEPEAKGGRFGPKVASWVGKMTEKALSGAWQVAAGQASATLVNALGSYYGTSMGVTPLT